MAVLKCTHLWRRAFHYWQNCTQSWHWIDMTVSIDGSISAYHLSPIKLLGNIVMCAQKTFLDCKDGLPVIHVGHSLSIVRMSCSSTEWPCYWHSNNRLRSVSSQCYIFFKVGGIWNWFCTHQPLVIKLIISYNTDIKKNCQLPKTVFSPLHNFAPFLSKNVPNL